MKIIQQILLLTITITLFISNNCLSWVHKENYDEVGDIKSTKEDNKEFEYYFKLLQYDEYLDLGLNLPEDAIWKVGNSMALVAKSSFKVKQNIKIFNRKNLSKKEFLEKIIQNLEILNQYSDFKFRAMKKVKFSYYLIPVTLKLYANTKLELYEKNINLENLDPAYLNLENQKEFNDKVIFLKFKNFNWIFHNVNILFKLKKINEKETAVLFYQLASVDTKELIRVIDRVPGLDLDDILEKFEGIFKDETSYIIKEINSLKIENEKSKL